MKLEPCFSPLTKVSSKWIKDLNIGTETLKLLVENIGNAFQDTGTGKIILGRGPTTQDIILRTDKYDCMKSRSFCKAKEAIIMVNRCCMERKKSVPTIHQIGDQCLIHRELQKLNTSTSYKSSKLKNGLVN